MRDLLIIDFGSSSNYGDKLVGQVVRQHLALSIPGIRIRSASSVPDAEKAGWWRLDPGRIDELLEGVGCVLLLGGSLFFAQALTVRGTWWIDALEERRMPLISWGGIQHVDGCYDYPDAFRRIVDYSHRLFYRFEPEARVFDDIAHGAPVEWGSDPVWCRPVVSPLPGRVLCTCITAPYADGHRNAEELGPLLEFVRGLGPYDQHVVLYADRGVLRCEEVGIEGLEAEEEHWIEHHAARAELLVSTRLHPTLYALSCGRPVVAADFSDKVTMLMEQVGLGHRCLPLATATCDDYRQVADSSMTEEERLTTTQNVVRCRERARWTLEQLVVEVQEATQA